MNVNDKTLLKVPGLNPEAIRDFFHKAVPLRTIVVMCPDPRATSIPEAIAKEFGQTWPGEVVHDDKGAAVGSTTNILLNVTTGARAVDALRSITSLNYLIGVENVVLVQHTFCGTTGWTPDVLIETYKREFGADISRQHVLEDISILDFEQTLRYDAALIRNSPGTPKTINIFGYIFDIDTKELSKVLEDRGIPIRSAASLSGQAA
ncbi:Carbonic anhydrase [Acidisarcina polymorpha]|uniref:Carbonic anhydrase n=1 Tax=Acidisarcina polymorpha TaxID=2211140 RepID=A0A2Z5G416_9BACT|nr:carbonic anhydrase [Acidisarcina polymorpha]AXC13933.1 Carbonic anhydrase [Acidisarcina polymorpha]